MCLLEYYQLVLITYLITTSQHWLLLTLKLLHFHLLTSLSYIRPKIQGKSFQQQLHTSALCIYTFFYHKHLHTKFVKFNICYWWLNQHIIHSTWGKTYCSLMCKWRMIQYQLQPQTGIIKCLSVLCWWYQFILCALAHPFSLHDAFLKTQYNANQKNTQSSQVHESRLCSNSWAKNR